MHLGACGKEGALVVGGRGPWRGRERGAGVGSLLVIFQASGAPLFELDVKCEVSEMPPRWCLSWRHSRWEEVRIVG